MAALENGVQFSEKDRIKGGALVSEGKVQSVLFSGGTYQIEVVDSEEFWTFLQVDDEGKLIDQFCTCDEASSKKTCPHLAAGMMVILKKEKEPLHVRFLSSLWNKLFQIAARRHGYEPSVLKAVDGEFQCISEKGVTLFSFKVKGPLAAEKASEWILNRKPETEETSLKFSNLDPHELDLWHRGTPSHALQYELSFWSDLAKWGMVLEEIGEVPGIEFSSEKLPKMITVRMREFDVEVYIAHANWPDLLPALATYQTTLKIFPFKDVVIEEIIYDADNQTFLLHSKPLQLNNKEDKEVEWEDWIYRPKVGFFPRKSEEFLKKKVIEKEEIPSFLQKYSKIVETYLSNAQLHRKSMPASYHIYFDTDENLHIETYLFSPGDLSKGKSHFFEPWAYLENDGFYKLTNLLFKGLEKVIPNDLMPEFIERNKLWLNKYEEFKIHLMSIESKLTFQVVGDTLKIKSDENFFGKSKETIDFGRWIYIKGQGFFAKSGVSSQKSQLAPVEVERDKVSTFIHEHREDLESIKGFFFSDPGLEKTGLIITLDENRKVKIEPKYDFKPWAKDAHPKIFGDFVYLPTKGFAEIPDTMKIPEKYTHTNVISSDELAYFIKHELSRIKPYILHLDTKLIEPTRLKLSCKNIHSEGRGWRMEFAYTSSYGEVELKTVYEAMMNFAPFIFSDAGMIVLKDKRFHWLMRLTKSSFDSEGGIYLSTLDWIRLSLFEDVRLPETDDPEKKKHIQALSDLQSVHTVDMPNLKGLKSNLRSYQEIGVRWLWFLYTYGLSGFLCDEMGLGKTHQAMALIAAAMNEKKKTERSKFLVVCPTSVIYHWQDLLVNFLPKASVLFYHGSERSPRELQLKRKYDIILTTYGILRSDKEQFAKEQFEVAVFDEMQVAKNMRSQIHRVLKLISAEMKLALTGTPIENHLEELKALFDIVLPNFLPPMQEFKEEFITSPDPDKQKTLARLIKPFILRRRKQDVLADLPDKIEEISYVELSDEQRSLYHKFAVKSKQLLAEEGENFYVHVFALLNHLKQVCNHPALISGNIEEFEKHESGKWDYFVELLEENRASGQKLVVFSQYLGMLDIIELYLQRQNISYATIRGSTKDRKGEVERFQTDPTCEVFVGSLGAAGVGIDLTAASVVIHYDRWWNPAKENQATDRVHRIGQNRGVSVFKLVTKDTIEEYIHTLIEKKKHLISNIVGFDSESEIKTLDRSELVLLLNQISKSI